MFPIKPNSFGKCNAPRWARLMCVRLAVYFLFGSIVLGSAAAHAASHNPENYPLRVHVYAASNRVFYSSNHSVEFVDGDGKGNLFENSEPKGFDFSFRCSREVTYSSGYETYPARWKKPGVSLEILLPIMGKPNATDACELKVLMKDAMAYHTRNGVIYEEPSTAYKEWMDRVHYDPEHGMNQPVEPAQSTPSANAK
jgi:hypothetical protein